MVLDLKAKLKKKVLSRGRVKVKATLETKVGAVYLVSYRVIPKANGSNNVRYKTKTFTDATKVLFKAPPVGKKLQVKYKIQMSIPGSADVVSNQSRVSTFKRRS